MTFWITTDTHLGHHKLVELGRPENFISLIIDRHMQRVRANDVLIHLGDICIGADGYWNNLFIESFPGKTKKWLTRGNHDSKSETWYLSHGWDFVTNYFLFEKYGKRIAFSHVPLPDTGWFDVNLHGHFHDSNHRSSDPELSAILTEKHTLVALEHTNYFPVKLETLVRG